MVQCSSLEMDTAGAHMSECAVLKSGARSQVEVHRVWRLPHCSHLSDREAYATAELMLCCSHHGWGQLWLY